MIMIRFSVIFMFSSWVSGNMQIHVGTWETFLATGQKHKSVKNSTISGFPRSVAATCQHADAVILSLCLYLFVCLLVWINLLSVCICISIAAIRWCSVAETGKSSCCRCSQLCNFVNLYFGFVICIVLRTTFDHCLITWGFATEVPLLGVFVIALPILLLFSSFFCLFGPM